jgi:hypothetical protein
MCSKYRNNYKSKKLSWVFKFHFLLKYNMRHSLFYNNKYTLFLAALDRRA